MAGIHEAAEPQRRASRIRESVDAESFAAVATLLLPGWAPRIVSRSLGSTGHSGRIVHELWPMIASKMLTAAMAIALGLTLQGCNSTEKTTGSISVSASDGVAEAARLIRTLDISTHLQESARNYAAKQVSLGIAPKPALEQWIAEQRDRGAVIRCKSEVSSTAECIART